MSVQQGSIDFLTKKTDVIYIQEKNMHLKIWALPCRKQRIGFPSDLVASRKGIAESAFANSLPTSKLNY